MGGNMSKVCGGCRLEAIKCMHKRLKPGPFSSPSAWERGYFILDNYCIYIFTLNQFVVDKQWKLSLLHKHILVFYHRTFNMMGKMQIHIYTTEEKSVLHFVKPIHKHGGQSTMLHFLMPETESRMHRTSMVMSLMCSSTTEYLYWKESLTITDIE